MAGDRGEVLEDRRREVVPGEDVGVSTEHQGRGVVQVLEELVGLGSDPFSVPSAPVPMIGLVRELVQVAALVLAEV